MPAIIQELTGTESDLACSACMLGTSQPLHRAASLGHTACLQNIVGGWAQKTPPQDHMLDDEGNSAIHAACAAGQTETLGALLSLTSIPTRLKNHRSNTAAHLAAERGRLEVLKILLGGPLPEAQQLAIEQNSSGQSVLHLAICQKDNDIALWLLKRFGITIALVGDQDGALPVHFAAALGNLEFIQTVTKFDLKIVNKRDIGELTTAMCPDGRSTYIIDEIFSGCSPCFYAAQSGHLACLKFLVDKARANLTFANHRQSNALHAACLNGHLPVAQYLLTRLDRGNAMSLTRDGATAVHCAAYSGQYTLLKLLQKAGWPRKYFVSLADYGGNTPLHLAAANGDFYTSRTLIEMGADPGMKNNAGETPLKIAQKNNHTEIVSLLMNTKADSKKQKRASCAYNFMLPFWKSGYYHDDLPHGYNDSASDSDSIVRVYRPTKLRGIKSPELRSAESGYVSARNRSPARSEVPDPKQWLKRPTTPNSFAYMAAEPIPDEPTPSTDSEMTFHHRTPKVIIDPPTQVMSDTEANERTKKKSHTIVIIDRTAQPTDMPELDPKDLETPRPPTATAATSPMSKRRHTIIIEDAKQPYKETHRSTLSDVEESKPMGLVPTTPIKNSTSTQYSFAAANTPQDSQDRRAKQARATQDTTRYRLVPSSPIGGQNADVIRRRFIDAETQTRLDENSDSGGQASDSILKFEWLKLIKDKGKGANSTNVSMFDLEATATDTEEKSAPRNPRIVKLSPSSALITKGFHSEMDLSKSSKGSNEKTKGSIFHDKFSPMIRRAKQRVFDAATPLRRLRKSSIDTSTDRSNQEDTVELTIVSSSQIITDKQEGTTKSEETKSINESNTGDRFELPNAGLITPTANEDEPRVIAFGQNSLPPAPKLDLPPARPVSPPSEPIIQSPPQTPATPVRKDSKSWKQEELENQKPIWVAADDIPGQPIVVAHEFTKQPRQTAHVKKQIAHTTEKRPTTPVALITRTSRPVKNTSPQRPDSPKIAQARRPTSPKRAPAQRPASPKKMPAPAPPTASVYFGAPGKPASVKRSSSAEDSITVSEFAAASSKQSTPQLKRTPVAMPGLRVQRPSNTRRAKSTVGEARRARSTVGVIHSGGAVNQGGHGFLRTRNSSSSQRLIRPSATVPLVSEGQGTQALLQRITDYQQQHAQLHAQRHRKALAERARRATIALAQGSSGEALAARSRPPSTAVSRAKTVEKPRGRSRSRAKSPTSAAMSGPKIQVVEADENTFVVQ